MTNSGGYHNIEEEVKEAQDDINNETAVTESGVISTGANTDEIFSDSAPGEASSAAGKDADEGEDVDSDNGNNP